jgi:hypothetical protein
MVIKGGFMQKPAQISLAILMVLGFISSVSAADRVVLLEEAYWSG